MLLITFMSLYPLQEVPKFSSNDKSLHLIAYFFLALPLGLRKPNKWILFIAILIIFGGIIEIIQPYVNRYGEWLDFFSNGLGVFFGFFTGLTLNKSLLTN